MAKTIKIISIIIPLVFVLFFFQNCVVQEDDNGNVATVESLPKQFNKIKLTTGYSESEAEMSSQLELNLDTNMVSGKVRELTSLNEFCLGEVEIDNETKSQLIKSYNDAKVCTKYVNAEPGTLCTLEINEMEFLKVYSDKEITFSVVLNRKECGFTGGIQSLCEGDELLDLLKSIQSDLQQACQ